MTNTDTRRGNGPALPKIPTLEDELSKLTRTVERAAINEKEHPALAACRKAAEMVRGVHERHAAEGETLAQHLEKVGQEVFDMCKEAAKAIRDQRIMPKEMSDNLANNIEHIGETETARQQRVASGLTAARDAILGIDNADVHGGAKAS